MLLLYDRSCLLWRLSCPTNLLSTILRPLPLAQATQQFSSTGNASNIAAGQAVPGRARYRLALADGLLEVVVGEEFPVVELDIKVRESRFAVGISGRE